MFRGDFTLGTKVLVEEHQDGGNDGEQCSKSKDDEVADTLRERRLAAKERLLPVVPSKRRKVVGLFSTRGPSHGFYVFLLKG